MTAMSGTATGLFGFHLAPIYVVDSLYNKCVQLVMSDRKNLVQFVGLGLAG